MQDFPRTRQEEVAEIVGQKDPVLRNLQITASYFRLSREIAGAVDEDNVNWSTFACWASKTAGISIRNEDLQNFAEERLGLSRRRLSQVGGFAAQLLELLWLGRLLRSVALETLSEVSEEIAVGNRKVYAELAPLFVRFVSAMKGGAGVEGVDELCASLEPGSASEGGQDLLASAFACWQELSQLSSPEQRAQLMLRANCQIGLHEQTRLQPHIKAGLDAPIDVLFRRRLRRRLPAFVGAPIAWLAMRLGRGLVSELSAFWARIATAHAMRLCLPGGEEISLGSDLQTPHREFPLALQVLSDEATHSLISRFDPQMGSTEGSGATDWTVLEDRMGFIVELFRSQQQSHQLFERPFTEEQFQDLERGKRPSGDLA